MWTVFDVLFGLHGSSPELSTACRARTACNIGLIAAYLSGTEAQRQKQLCGVAHHLHALSSLAEMHTGLIAAAIHRYS